MSKEQLNHREVEQLLVASRLKGGSPPERIMFAAGMSQGIAKSSERASRGWKIASILLAASLVISLGVNVGQSVSLARAKSPNFAQGNESDSKSTNDRLAEKDSLTESDEAFVLEPKMMVPVRTTEQPAWVSGSVMTITGRDRNIFPGQNDWRTNAGASSDPNAVQRIPRLGSF